jgi:hypothetical protein
MNNLFILMYNLMRCLTNEKEIPMKRFAVVVFIGALVALPMRIGYAKSLNEWFIKPGGSPPVINHWFASEELHHGDTWNIYVVANDPDGDMREFVGILDQAGYGGYSSSYVRIKKRHRKELKGYLVFFSSAGEGSFLAEWTQLNLTLFIRDKGGNASNKVVFPLVLSRGAKQGSPPPPFDRGRLDKLGVVWFDLVDPERDGDDNELLPP